MLAGGGVDAGGVVMALVEASCPAAGPQGAGQGEGGGGGGGAGPRAACFGVALLDAALGELRAGEVRGDGPSRTQLHTLLLRHPPAHVVAPHAGLAPATSALLARLGGGGGAAGLLRPLPAAAFGVAGRAAFAPSSHLEGVRSAAVRAAGERARQHATQLVGPLVAPGAGVQGRSGASGPEVLREALEGEAGARWAAEQPLAAQAVAVLLQHLQRCGAMRAATRSLVLLPLEEEDAAGGSRGGGPGALTD